MYYPHSTTLSCYGRTQLCCWDVLGSNGQWCRNKYVQCNGGYWFKKGDKEHQYYLLHDLLQHVHPFVHARSNDIGKLYSVRLHFRWTPPSSIRICIRYSVLSQLATKQRMHYNNRAPLNVLKVTPVRPSYRGGGVDVRLRLVSRWKGVPATPTLQCIN